MAEEKLIIAAKKYGGESAVVSARLPVVLIKRLDDICDMTGRTKMRLSRCV